MGHTKAIAKTMTFRKYKALREKLYKESGIVGTMAEGIGEHSMLNTAYMRLCHALDAIDTLGEELGYIDPETNSYIDEI